MDTLPILDELWTIEEPNIYISKDEFVRAFDGWECKEIISGDPEFLAFVKGPEFHYYGRSKTRPLPLRAIKVFLGKIIAEHGFALTKTAIDDDRQRRFNELIGFENVGQGEFFIHYKIERFKRCRS